MNTLYINPGSIAVYYDATKNNASPLQSESWSSYDIDWLYTIPEDCEVRTTVDGKTYVQKAQKGDIIIQFYNRSTVKNITAIVKNKEWKENIVYKNAKLTADRAFDQCVAAENK